MKTGKTGLAADFNCHSHLAQALNGFHTEGHEKDSGGFKHQASACGGKSMGGRLGPSGCRYTNGKGDPAQGAVLVTRAMKPDSSPKRTEAQRKEEEEDLGGLKVVAADGDPLSESASRQHGRHFYNGHDETQERRTLEHMDGQTTNDHKKEDQGEKDTVRQPRWSQYSSPWLTVTPEGAGSTEEVRDAKREDGLMTSTEQSEHHRHHHHDHQEIRGDDKSQLEDAAEANNVSVGSTGT